MDRVLLLRGAAKSPHPQHGLVPPYNLASLAAHIEDLATVCVFDGALYTLEETVQVVRDFNPDLVGITAFTTTLVPRVLDLAREIKNWNKRLRIVLGGHGVTFIAHQVLSTGCIDAIVRGEGEFAFREIVAQDSFEGVKGVSHIRDGQIIHNEPRENIPDLDQLRFPAWHYLDLSNIMIFPVETSRGCVLRCNFCDVGRFWGYTPRYKSIERVLEEIRCIQVDWRGNAIMIADDNFCNSTERIEQFCEMILRNREQGKLGPINIYGQVSAPGIVRNPSVAPLLRRVGFELVYLGVESPFEDTLIKMDREAGTFQEACEAVKLLHQNNIEVHANFIVGYPHETLDMLQATFQKAKALNADFCSFNLIVPYPGSAIYDRWQREGLLVTQEWDKYDRQMQVVRTPHMPEVDIVGVIADWHQQYYFCADWIKRYLGPQETVTRWSIHRGVWYTHYHDTKTMEQMQEILGGYQRIVGEKLRQELSDYNACVKVETDIGNLWLEITQGQIAQMETGETVAWPIDLVVSMTNKDLNRLLGDIQLDSLSGFVLEMMRGEGELVQKLAFIYWVDVLQDIIKTRLISLAHDNPLCLPQINSRLAASPHQPGRHKMFLLTGPYADLYIRKNHEGFLTEFQLVRESTRQKRARRVAFPEVGWTAMLVGNLGPLTELIKDLD